MVVENLLFLKNKNDVIYVKVLVVNKVLCHLNVGVVMVKELRLLKLDHF